MKKKGTKWLFERNNQLRKLFKIMRLSVILLFIGMHLTFANVGAQSKVTIEHQFVTSLVSTDTSNKISKCQKREIKLLYNN